jgi:PAS domain S-box-containing protein
VLLIEDVEDDALLLVRELQQGGFDVTHRRVETADGIEAALGGGEWDLVISDHGMPTFSGFEALTIVRARAPDMPFIVVSGTIREGDAVAAMRAGAHDYVMKGNLSRLVPAVVRELNDVEERRRARLDGEALRAKSEVLRCVIAASPVAIIATDLDGRVTLWNPAAGGLFGWTEAEALGHRNPTIPNQWFARPDAQGGASAGRNAGVDRETKWRRKDGTWVEVGISIATTHDFAGVPDGMTFFVLDLTERNRLEAQFLQAQKMDAIGKLAGGLAHDFNNILTIITSYAEQLLADTARDDPRALDLREIVVAAEAATTLTRQLLSFSRPREFQRRVVDLNDVIARASHLVERLIGVNVTITLHLHPAAGVVEADASQIEQVAMNLILNARDAMPNGGTVAIDTRRVSADEAHGGREGPPSGDYFMLAVADEGIGMDAATQSRIFEPFFTTKGEASGTGLGLATVYRIVEQHGGTIRVSSTLGRGTTFWVYFPLAEAIATFSPLR